MVTGYLDSALKYIELLPLNERPIRMFCIIPFVLGYNTLEKIARLEGNKLSRKDVSDIIKKSNIYAQSNSSLADDYFKIKERYLSLYGLS
jgi:hypothetical protein